MLKVGGGTINGIGAVREPNQFVARHQHCKGRAQCVPFCAEVVELERGRETMSVGEILWCVDVDEGRVIEVEAVEIFAGQLTPQKAVEHVPYPTFGTF